jgi:hypothetical protein
MSREDQELARQIDLLESYKRELRKRERALNARDEALSSEFQVPGPVQDLRSNLLGNLPPNLMPLNVGEISEVAWPFWYSVTFNFTGLTSLNNTIRQTQSFQVTQESGFIITSMSRNFLSGYNTVGGLAPWSLTFRDRQSSRQMNNAPLPVQYIGEKSWPTKLATPFLLNPNAFFDVELQCEAVQSYAIPASDMQLQITFAGVRMRMDASDKVLAKIYSK